MKIIPTRVLRRVLDDNAFTRLVDMMKRQVPAFTKRLRSVFLRDLTYSAIIQRLWQDVIKTDHPSIIALERDAARNDGSSSRRAPWPVRRPMVEEYFHHDVSPDLEALEYAFEQVKRIVGSGYRATSLETAYERMPRNTFLGLPVLTSEWEYSVNYLRRAKKITRWEEILPAVVVTRVQQSAFDAEWDKTRNVWAMDHAETILALSLLHPILERVTKLREFIGMNHPDVVDVEITKWLDERKGVIISADYSAFDASLPGVVIGKAFDVLRHAFSGDSTALERITIVEGFFRHGGLVTPDGIYTERDGGVPSGSGLTNLIDSLCNLLAYYYAAHRLSLEPVSASVLGDDALYQYSPDVELNALSSVIGELGLTFNSDKSSSSESEIHFLQRLHMTDYRIDGVCRGVRSIIRTVLSSVNYERPNRLQWSGETEAIRFIMQLENCKWHPDFHGIVRFYWENDRVLRNSSPQRILRRAKNNPDLEEYLGVNRWAAVRINLEQFSSFVTVKVLQEIAATRRLN